MSAQPALLVDDVTRRFGGLLALDGVDLEIRSGDIVGIIGPNGAGKTTLFNVLSGFDRADHGAVTCFGERLDGRQPTQIADLGIRRTFQGYRVFPGLTVAQHLIVGSRRPRRLVGWGVTNLQTRHLPDHLWDLAVRLELDHQLDRLAGGLPPRDRALVGLGTAIAQRPRVLLADEPIAGLTEGESSRVLQVLRDEADHGVAVGLIEHNVRLAARTCDRMVALVSGRVVAAGSPDEVLTTPEVVAAYLGGGHDD